MWPARAPRLDWFFFQAEDGIRDATVTGVQTCALPIFLSTSDVRDQDLQRTSRVAAQPNFNRKAQTDPRRIAVDLHAATGIVFRIELHIRKAQIGRASCRERR